MTLNSMRIIDFYLSCYYVFFISKNHDIKWASTRSAGLMVIVLHLILVSILIIVFSFILNEKELFTEFNKKNKSIVPLVLIIYSFAVQYLLSTRVNTLAKSSNGITNHSSKEKWIAWLTIPCLFIIFFLLMILAFNN